jgi:hypothetical protein
VDEVWKTKIATRHRGLKQLFRRADKQVRSVLRAHGIDVPEDTVGELCTHLIRMWKGVAKPIETAELHRKFSSLRDKFDRLLREVETLPDVGWSTFKWTPAPPLAETIEEHHVADIRIEIARVRDAFQQAAEIWGPGRGKQGRYRYKPDSVASIKMYRALRRAGVTVGVMKCSKILVDILHGELPEEAKQKAVDAMRKRLERIP